MALPLFERLKNEIMLSTLELAFPIGKEYITQTDTNPSEILGFGTWERVKGQLLIGLDEDDEKFNEIGKTGGNNEVTLTKANLPDYTLYNGKHKHKHPYSLMSNNGIEASSYAGTEGNTYYQIGMLTKETEETQITVKSGGSNTPIDITNPYQVVGYMWIRTA